MPAGPQERRRVTARHVLVVSPHFPPDPTAGAHRARLIVRHLREFKWTPVVLAAEPGPQEARDDRLIDLVPSDVEVHRIRPWPLQTTRRLGFGDLGLRSLTSLRRAGTRLLQTGRFAAIFVTIYPTYPALLVPAWSRRFRVPFVIDYQDPWVGEWGLTVGGGPEGSPDLRSRVSRGVSQVLEPRVLSAAAGVTAVSSQLTEELRRHATFSAPRVTLPIGAEEGDFDAVRRGAARNRMFDRSDGCLHIVYVGTVLPAGRRVLEAVLAGVQLLRERTPTLGTRVRLHFIGSSNQADATAAPVVTPVADTLGVADCVREHPARLPYLDALALLEDADVILALGSTEQRYTASKLYPALLANRPVLGVYRAGSDSAVTLQRIERETSGRRVIPFDDPLDTHAVAQCVARHLAELLERGRDDAPPLERHEVNRWSARTVACRLAELLTAVAAPRAMSLQ